MIKRVLVASLAAVAVLLLTAPSAHADEKFLGKVTRIEMAGKDAPVATATLRDDAGKSLVITVEDKLTLDKFADKRIGVGDEIKTRYVLKGGKNLSTFFKKPGGC